LYSRQRSMSSHHPVRPTTRSWHGSSADGSKFTNLTQPLRLKELQAGVPHLGHQPVDPKSLDPFVWTAPAGHQIHYLEDDVVVGFSVGAAKRLAKHLELALDSLSVLVFQFEDDNVA
jgi:hypothetical protein